MRDFWRAVLIFGGGGFLVWKLLLVPPGGRRAPNLTINRNFLSYGAVGPDVEAVQLALDFLGYSAGNIDGHFGPLTNEAVRRFQSDQRIAVDGIIGPDTIAALNTELQKYGGSFVLVDRAFVGN